MIAILEIAALTAALCIGFVNGDAPPAIPRITSVSYSGNGCPNDADRAGDLNSPTFTFRHFVANSPGTDQTANCEIHLQAAGGSPGWQVSVREVNVRGRVVLDPGMRLNYYVQSFFSQDAGNTASAREAISSDGGQTVDHPVQITQGLRDVWSPCIGGDGSPGILNVNFRVALVGGGRGYFQGDTESLSFNWRRC